MATHVNKHGENQFKPNVTVAAIIVHQNKFLLVEELENGKAVFNQPAGHLEENENLVSALQREVLEETGLVVEPTYCSGIYYFYRNDLALHYMRFCFVVELPNLATPCPQDEEIIAGHWLTLAEIYERKSLMRSPIVLACIEDYLAGGKNGEKIPLSMLKSNL